MHIHTTANIIAALTDTLVSDQALTPATIWQGGVHMPEATWTHAVQAKQDLRVIAPERQAHVFVGSAQDVRDLEDLFADR